MSSSAIVLTTVTLPLRKISFDGVCRQRGNRFETHPARREKWLWDTTRYLTARLF